MSKITVILSSNFQDLKKSVIGNVDEKSDWENIIIVPDRFSLLAELSAFEQTGESCLFNTQVMPITRFVTHFLEQISIIPQKISREEECFLVRRSMQKVKDKLTVTKHVTQPLCAEIAKIITQLKSCNIKSEELETKDLSNSLAAKFEDIKLIYQTYENLLGDKVDGSKMLNLFQSKVGQISLLTSVNLYFVGFESFTNQVFEIIKALVPHVHKIYIGAFYHYFAKNKSVFDIDIYSKMKLLSKEIEIDFVNAKSSLNQNQMHVMKQVFANNIEGIENDFISIFGAENFKQEINFVIADILKNIKNNNMRFADFAIAHGNLNSVKQEIEIELEKHHINYYLDTSISLGKTSFIAFIFGFYSLLLSNFDKDNLKNFFSSMFLPLDFFQKSQIIALIEKYTIEGNAFLKKTTNFLQEDKQTANNFYCIADKLIALSHRAKKCFTVEDYINLTRQFLADFDTQNMLEKLKTEQTKQIKMQKIYMQVFEKFNECLDSVQKYLFDEKVSQKEYFDIIKACAESKQISTVPISGDSVFVGDATDSFFGSVKVLYVIGAGADNLPKTIFDSSFISDDNIAEAHKYFSITPTVKMINKRNKLKLLSLLATPTQRLVITYPQVIDGKEAMPSSFVSDLCSAFLTNGKKTDIQQISKFAIIAEDDYSQQVKQICNNIFTPFSAKEFLFKHGKQSIYNQKIINSLYSVLKKHGFITDSETMLFAHEQTTPLLQNARELFFPKNSTKISQIERYYSSPFKHFISYGLRLQDQPTGEIQKVDVGNFLHFVAQKFLEKTNLYKTSPNDFNALVDSITQEAIQDEQFYKFNLNGQNKALFSYLKIEAKNLCSLIAKNIEKSNFKPTKIEQGFFIPNYFENNISLAGRVDRIDEFENMFTIIDYKTGKIALNEKLVFEGQKIQLFVYADAIGNNEKICAGVFYFPVKQNFEEKFDGKMQGMFAKNDFVIFNLDNTLGVENTKSTLIKAELKKAKSGEKTEFYDSTGTMHLPAMILYSKQLCQKAINQILEGHVDNVSREEKTDIFENPIFKTIIPKEYQIEKDTFEKVVKKNDSRR